MPETTTLAVPRKFADMLREGFAGSNDYERLKNWAEDEYGYKDSITNEDLMQAIEDIQQESYKDSISQDEVREAVENALPAGAFR
ncbi:MAG: hypothetical protein ABEJ56_00030 [Candidatus Nanohaloarchaea archaeon]